MKRFLSGLFMAAVLCVLFVCVPMRADAAAMTSSNEFIEILKQREDFSKYPYKDNSQWSIGYGTRVPSGMLQYYKDNGITKEEAEKLMLEMLADFEAAVLKFAKKYDVKLSQNQFDALVSFSYNCGTAWLSEMDGNMNRAVREGWTGSDFLYAICLWSKSGKQYSLINRRMYEANMYINGIYESPYDYENGTFRYVFLEAGLGETTYVIHGYDTNDPKPVHYEFEKIPTGKDADGNTFSYEFAGWYTAPENGKLIEVLDNTLEKASVIYAMWTDPDGNLVYLPKGEACDNITVIVKNVDSYANVRSGPGSHYSKVGELKKNTVVTLQHVYNDGKNIWGQFDGGWFCLEYSNYNDVIKEQEVWPKSGEVNGENVNVRSGPGTSYSIQYKLDTGDRVTVVTQTYAGSRYWGKLEDGNWIALSYVTFDVVTPEPEPEPEPDPDPDPEQKPSESVDFDGNGVVDEDDTIYLLQHLMMPQEFPVTRSADLNGSGTVNEDDVVYLLQHILHPASFPVDEI